MEFIELVREHPILYNKACVSYSNTNKRATIWNKIAETMSFADSLEAHRKWRYLRDKYVKYKRMLERCDDKIRDDDYDEWPLFRQLSFLEQHVRKR